MKNKLEQLKERYYVLPIQVRAAFWFMVCSFMQRGISSITTPIFTRLLSTEEYGQYSVFNSWLGIVTVFVSLNLSAGVYMQGLVKYEDRRKEYASSLQGLTMLLVAVWTVVYLAFHNFWNGLFELTTVQMLAMLIMIWMSAAFGFWASSERVVFRYRKLVLITVLVSIAKPLLGIFLLLHAEDKVTARILGLAVVELIGYSGLMVSQIIKGKKLCVPEFWKHALMFNIPLIPHYLSTTVLNSADRIMIEKMVSADTAGIYSLAYSISQLMTLFTTGITQTLEPWRYSKQKAGRQEEIATLAYPTLILVAGLNLALIAFAPEVVRIFAPPEYHEAIWIIPPVAMSVYFMFTYGFFASFEFYFEKTGYVAAATMAGAVLNIILNYIFIGIFGYFAAGYTTLVCYIVYAACHYLGMKKICKDNLGGKKVYSLKKLLAISGIFMAFGFAIQFTYLNTYVRYAAIVIFVTVLLIKRKWIIETVKQIMSVKGSKKKGKTE